MRPSQVIEEGMVDTQFAMYRKGIVNTSIVSNIKGILLIRPLQVTQNFVEISFASYGKGAKR